MQVDKYTIVVDGKRTILPNVERALETVLSSKPDLLKLQKLAFTGHGAFFEGASTKMITLEDFPEESRVGAQCLVSSFDSFKALYRHMADKRMLGENPLLPDQLSQNVISNTDAYLYGSDEFVLSTDNKIKVDSLIVEYLSTKKAEMPEVVSDPEPKVVTNTIALTGLVRNEETTTVHSKKLIFSGKEYGLVIREFDDGTPAGIICTDDKTFTYNSVVISAINMLLVRDTKPSAILDGMKRNFPVTYESPSRIAGVDEEFKVSSLYELILLYMIRRYELRENNKKRTYVDQNGNPVVLSQG